MHMPPKVLQTFFLLPLLMGVACQSTSSKEKNRPTDLRAAYGSPVVDGSGADSIWEISNWYPIDCLWQGQQPKPTDFTGKYKMAWDENNLYILVEIEDDTLTEALSSGEDHPRQADCLLLFLDEDASGGEYAHNYNAFAYHILLDGRVLAPSPDSNWQALDDHCWVRRLSRGNISTWEIALRVYDGNQYSKDAENIPKLLKGGKKMGFAIAYGDRDYTEEWESLTGSSSAQKQPWKNADGFYSIHLQ